MRELMLDVDCTNGRRAGLERAIRDAVRSGRLTAGTMLPSTRALAGDLGFARATVVAAYEQLTVEGYLLARQGSATVVAPVRVPSEPAQPVDVARSPRQAADFRPGEPDGGMFPRAAWLRSTRRVLTDAPDDAFGYGDPLGRWELRRSLTEYLGRSRAVHTDPDGVSVVNGLQSGFGLLGEVFLRHGIERVAVEDPSLFLLHQVLRVVGVTAVPVPVDDDGIDVDALDRTGVGAVIVTPSHQYPTGITMSPSRRADLVRWAQARDAWIVEDDYDGEFRYDRQSIGAVQGLDPDRVIYAGTCSKMLAPGLRLAWLVVPPELRADLREVKHLRAGVSVIDQLAFADALDRGVLDRHLRAARKIYRRRREALSERVTDAAPWLSLSTAQAGLHVAARIETSSIAESDLVARATEQGIGVFGFGPHWLAEPSYEGLVLGYSRPAEHEFDLALDLLGDFLSSV